MDPSQKLPVSPTRLIADPCPASPAPTPEPFVEADVAAEFLHRRVRWVKQKAREGKIRAHPFGDVRKQWYFLISELAEDLRSKVNSAHGEAGRDKTRRGVQ